MAKRKPDPETQKASFDDVPSEITFIFDRMVRNHTDLEFADGKRSAPYVKMTKQEKRALRTEFFAKMVIEYARYADKTSFLWVGDHSPDTLLEDYRFNQKWLRAQQDDKENNGQAEQGLAQKPK